MKVGAMPETLEVSQIVGQNGRSSSSIANSSFASSFAYLVVTNQEKMRCSL